jgi:Anti-sigma-K factor rskA/Sigma-70, region 4
MATFDQLSADKRAIVELVLQQGKSYDELSGMLGMSEDRVRSLARDALVELAPLSATRVEEDWRGQLADYVLGQQSGPEATATRGHLRRSEAARTWASSLLDSLDQLYENGSMPAIPEGERRRRSLRPMPAADSPSAPALPVVRDVVMRRRIAAGAALVALVLVALLLWPIGLLGGGDGDEGTQASAPDTAARGAAGIAVFLGQRDQRVIRVDATGLESSRRFAYQVWLYNSPRDVKSLGGQVADANGNFQGVNELPKGFQKYRFIDISREPLNDNRTRTHSGQSVLRGAMPRLAAVRGNRAAILGQVVLEPPAP